MTSPLLSRSWGLRVFFWPVLAAALAASCGSASTATQSTETSISINFDASDSEIPSVATPIETIPSNGQDSEATRSRLLYVSVSGEQAIKVLRLGTDGSLTRLERLDLALTDEPGPMVLASQRRRLYVGVGDTVATIALGNDGELESVVRDDLVGVPVYLDLSADEALMVSAYFGDDQVAGHVLPVGQAEGTSINIQTTNVETGDEPHAAHYNPAHDLIYVPHRTGNMISWFSQEGSELTLVGEIEVEGQIGPRHITFSSDGAWAYVVNETGVSVSAYQVGPEGGLELAQTISALPAGNSAEGNSGADLHLTPNGKFLYASVRGDDSLAWFKVNPDGELELMGRTATVARPREFSITPDGRFLVAAGQDSGDLASYEIRSDGALVLLDTQEVGNGPVWVAID